MVPAVRVGVVAVAAAQHGLRSLEREMRSRHQSSREECSVRGPHQHPTRRPSISWGAAFEIDLSAFPEPEPVFAYVDDVGAGVEVLHGLVADGRMTVHDQPPFMWLDGPIDCIRLKVTPEGVRPRRAAFRSLGVGELCLEVYHVHPDRGGRLIPQGRLLLQVNRCVASGSSKQIACWRAPVHEVEGLTIGRCTKRHLPKSQVHALTAPARHSGPSTHLVRLGHVGAAQSKRLGVLSRRHSGSRYPRLSRGFTRSPLRVNSASALVTVPGP